MTHTLYVTSPRGGREGANMYIKPELKVEEADVVSMLAESLTIDGNTTVDGGDALTKESSWEIWKNDKEVE